MLEIKNIKVHENNIVCICEEHGVNSQKFTMAIDKNNYQLIRCTTAISFAVRQAHAKIYRLIRENGLSNLPSKAYVNWG